MRLDDPRREIAGGRVEDGFTVAAIYPAGVAGVLPD